MMSTKAQRMFAGVTSRPTMLTPKLAQEFIDATEAALERKGVVNYRIKNDLHADNLAHDIKTKKYYFNGQSLVVDKHGVIIDGQHRCYAVVATGIAIPIILVRGIPNTDAVKRTIDIGRPRTFVDHLRFHGYKNAISLSGAVSWVKAYDMTKWRSSSTRKGTREDLHKFFRSHTDIADSLPAGIQMRRFITASIVAAFHYLATRAGTRVDNEKQLLEEYIEGIATGADLPQDDARYWVRKRLMEDKNSDKRVKLTWRVAMLVHGWNHYKRFSPMTSQLSSWIRFRTNFPDFE